MKCIKFYKFIKYNNLKFVTVVFSSWGSNNIKPVEINK